LFLRLFRLEQNCFAVKGEQIRWLMEEAIGIGAQRARLERWAALSHCQLALARLCSEYAHQAAAVTACHVLSASPRNWRSV